MFISPEIGALIGAVVDLGLLLGQRLTFGDADSTLNWLDFARRLLGIMAAAVSMLMIGGEFDLSSGVMTGATAIQIGLVSRFFMGAGVNIGWAIGSAFLAAAAVGWFNGFMVNKTGLPSFIVTLASFFTLRGVMLVISKRLVGKVQVGDISDANGFSFWSKVFASDWDRTEHVWNQRDKVYTVFLRSRSRCLIVVAIVEMQFSRKRDGIQAGRADPVRGRHRDHDRRHRHAARDRRPLWQLARSGHHRPRNDRRSPRLRQLATRAGGRRAWFAALHA